MLLKSNGERAENEVRNEMKEECEKLVGMETAMTGCQRKGGADVSWTCSRLALVR